MAARSQATPAPSTTATAITSTDRYGHSITLNERQAEFVTLASQGQSCILIGAAGTGKTTCMKQAAITLVQSSRTAPLATDHKYLNIGAPGIIFTAYTRRAVANLKRNLPEDLKGNCITIHKLLEYEPRFYEVQDPETGDYRKTMRFEPNRRFNNPLPYEISTIVIDESSMVSVELYNEIIAALGGRKIQFIFLGDIQQLPPIFGSAILGYKMLELPTVELTEVYRQALESPIIRLAHRILSGNGITSAQLSEWKYPGKLTLHPWKKKIHAEVALTTFAGFITKALESELYDPYQDVVLSPFNKAFGTIEINNHIATYLARKNNRIVHQIIAGFSTYYFAVGDKILYDKEDAEIIAIEPNPAYLGKQPKPASATLDYWGHEHNTAAHTVEDGDEVDFMLSQMEASGVDAGEDRVKQASHIITIRRYDDTGSSGLPVSSAGQINTMSLGYAITIHKSQGSEWRRVFLVLHQSHATMLQRELLYTAVTRAKEELYVICEPDSFMKGISSQRIKGNNLTEKAEHFKGKIAAEGNNVADQVTE
jgi:ATP-dependent exoDNAse (exonuclease V) alpha subunit